MQDRAEKILRQRLTEFDTLPEWSDLPETHEQLIRFIDNMARYTTSTMESLTGEQAILDAARADSLIAECRLFTEIATPLTVGPIDLRHQQWIGSGTSFLKPGEDPASTESRTPSRSRFTTPYDRIDDKRKPLPFTLSRPFGFGFYTSTITELGCGMWRTYLESNSSLFSKPWYEWEIQPEPEAKVLEITCAREWTQLVTQYQRSGSGFIYPDWVAVSADFDAVHLTARGVAAVQGFCFPTSRGLTAPVYWDVESTLWLRWCFSSTTLTGIAE
jgi:hypothetical protein